MGRSKFPGKPSKLVTKKRVSVLSGNTSNAFLNASNELDANESSINQRNRLNATSLNRDTGTKFNTLINDIPTSHQEINNKLKNESKVGQNSIILLLLLLVLFFALFKFFSPSYKSYSMAIQLHSYKLYIYSSPFYIFFIHLVISVHFPHSFNTLL